MIFPRTVVLTMGRKLYLPLHKGRKLYLPLHKGEVRRGLNADESKITVPENNSHKLYASGK